MASKPLPDNPRFVKSPRLRPTIPVAIRHIFRHFPFLTYSADNLPSYPHAHWKQDPLPVPIYLDSNQNGTLSLDPPSLKWQTILRLEKVGFLTIPSSNRDLVAGARPVLNCNGEFLQAKNVDSSILVEKFPELLVRPRTRIRNPLEQAYVSLLDAKIRPFYLYLKSIYFRPGPAVSNSSQKKRYTSNPLVEYSLDHNLRSIVLEECLSLSSHAFGTVSIQDLLEDVYLAWNAIDHRLNGQTWFSDAFTMSTSECSSYKSPLGASTSNRPLDSQTSCVNRLGDTFCDHNFNGSISPSVFGRHNDESDSRPFASSTPDMLDASLFAISSPLHVLSHQIPESVAGSGTFAQSHRSLLEHSDRMNDISTTH